MSFWGIEIKPGEPVTHSFSVVQRRLRISQATLGTGRTLENGLVQCNVGNRRPVFICALLPERAESCHLDLEFEEADDVTFSVIGPRSVYLTGYYVGNYRHSALPSDTESYGEDIAETETEESSRDSEEDGYDDSFIDDSDDPAVFRSSPIPMNGVTQEIVDKTKKEGKGNKRQLRQMILSSDSDEQTASPGSEDEEKVPLSVLIGKKTVDQIVAEVEEKTDNVEDDINGKINRTDNSVHVLGETEVEKKTDEMDDIKIDIYDNVNATGNSVHVDAAALLQESTSELDPLNNSKSTREQDSDHLEGCEQDNEKTLGKDKVSKPEAETDGKHQDLVLPNEPELIVYGETHSLVHSGASVEGQNPKKRKKTIKKKKSKGRNDTASNEIILNDQFRENVTEHGKEGKDQLATISEDKKPDAHEDTDFDVLADGAPLGEPERKKKKGKTKKNKHDNMNVSEEPSTPNELVIEELAVGDLDGKIAALGRKVKVHYTGMLKESGRVFSSTIGGAPYKFRLGNEDILDGWNVGIEGMRVGDQRRLTIPPSMGYGEQGDGENIPPNSWVVFDIELVSVI